MCKNKTNHELPRAGLEPATPRLEVWCAIHCANGALSVIITCYSKRRKINRIGPAGIRTRIEGFRVPSDSHYTTGPTAYYIDITV